MVMMIMVMIIEGDPYLIRRPDDEAKTFLQMTFLTLPVFNSFFYGLNLGVLGFWGFGASSECL